MSLMRQVVIDTNCLVQMISLHSPYRPIWNDNKFVDCAFAANAEYLVSDDKHFKILQRTPFPQLNLVRMAEFLNIIATE